MKVRHPHDCRPLIRVGDFVGGELNLTSLKFIDPKIDAHYERSRLLGSELLVSCVGSIDTVCKVPLEASGYNIARAVARVPLGPSGDRNFRIGYLDVGRRPDAPIPHFFACSPSCGPGSRHRELAATPNFLLTPEHLAERSSVLGNFLLILASLAGN